MLTINRKGGGGENFHATRPLIRVATVLISRVDADTMPATVPSSFIRVKLAQAMTNGCGGRKSSFRSVCMWKKNSFESHQAEAFSHVQMEGSHQLLQRAGETNNCPIVAPWLIAAANSANLECGWERTAMSVARSFGRVSWKFFGSCRMEALTIAASGGASIAVKATRKSLTSLGVSRWEFSTT